MKKIARFILAILIIPVALLTVIFSAVYEYLQDDTDWICWRACFSGYLSWLLFK